MNKHLAVALASVCLISCTGSQATVARMDGFNRSWRGYQSIKAPPAQAELTLNIRVIITEDIGFPDAVGTYSHPQGIIRVTGKVVNGRIVTCAPVLGHELQHALEYQGKGFMNPDQLTEEGL